MKRIAQHISPVIALVSAATLSLILIGCAALGTNPTPPTKLESALFSTVTNYYTVTNLVAVATPVYTTNQITVTNLQNQTITTLSNVLNVTWQTNLVPVVTNVPGYTLTTSDTTKAAISQGAAVANTFFPGAGTIGGALATLIVGAWGYLRSSKLGDTSSALAQEIETGREFIRALPNGAQYDSAFVQFLQAHQAEAGVLNQVAAIVDKEVSNPDAKAGAQQVIATLNSLKGLTTPLGPVSA